MKILQVIGTLESTAGGPVEGLIQQGVQMSARGHDVYTVCLDQPGTALDKRIASQAVYLLGPRVGGYAFAARLEPWLREHGAYFDVIIVHGLWQYPGYCVAKVARELGLKYVVFLHGMLDPWFAREFPLKHLKKWLYWPWAEYRTLRDARLVLFTTAEELRLARESFWLYKARERLVGYGISPRALPVGSAKETFFSKFPALRSTRNLLYLSRIHPKKGCDLLIRAFAAVASSDPQLHLVMAGPDETGWQSALTAEAQQLGIAGRVTFTGMLKAEMKWGAYDAAEAFVLPSHQENFGIVVAEALASSVPVLTTFNVNIWREIQDASAGFIDEDTQAGTERSLNRWLSLDQAQKQEMIQNAMECFRKNFEISNVVGNLIGALESVCAGEQTGHTFKGRFLKVKP
jgi:glycosyltransferase involved in cell wall biosynthesis